MTARREAAATEIPHYDSSVEAEQFPAHDENATSRFTVRNDGYTEPTEYKNSAAPEPVLLAKDATALVKDFGNGRQLVRIDRAGQAAHVIWDSTNGYDLDTALHIDPITEQPLQRSPSATSIYTPPVKAPSMHVLTTPGNFHVEHGEIGDEEYVHIRALKDYDGQSSLPRALSSSAKILLEHVEPLDFEDPDDEGSGPGTDDPRAAGTSSVRPVKPLRSVAPRFDEDPLENPDDEQVYYRRGRLKAALVGGALFVGLTFVTDNIGYAAGHIYDDGVKGLFSDVVNKDNPIKSRSNPFIGVIDTGNFVWHTLGG